MLDKSSRNEEFVENDDENNKDDDGDVLFLSPDDNDLLFDVFWVSFQCANTNSIQVENEFLR